MRNALRAVTLAVTISLTAALGGCATTYVMASDPAVPFAKGEVDATFEQNGNGRMLVKVEHLGEAGRLDPSATTYVVWIKPEKSDAPKVVNMGALKVDADYRGELEFVTPYEKFEVMITPEKRGDVPEPTGRHVLQAKVARDERPQKTQLGAPKGQPVETDPEPADAAGSEAPASEAPGSAPATPPPSTPPRAPAPPQSPPATVTPPAGAPAPAAAQAAPSAATEPGASPSVTHLSP